jgi:hypothetical protein
MKCHRPARHGRLEGQELGNTQAVLLEWKPSTSPLRVSCCGSCQLVIPAKSRQLAAFFFSLASRSRLFLRGTRHLPPPNKETARNQQVTRRCYFWWLCEFLGLRVSQVRGEWKATREANHSGGTQLRTLKLMPVTRATTTSAPSHNPPTVAVYETPSRTGKRRSARRGLGTTPTRDEGRRLAYDLCVSEGWGD